MNIIEIVNLEDFEKLHDKIINSFVEDLSDGLVEGAHKNSNPYEYVANILIRTLPRLEPKDIKIIFEACKSDTHWTTQRPKIIEAYFPALSNARKASEHTVLKTSLFMLLVSLAFKKICKFPSYYVFIGSLKSIKGNKFHRIRLLKILPPLIMDLFIYSSPSRLENLQMFLSQEWADISGYHSTTTYKSWIASSGLLFNMCCANGIDSFTQDNGLAELMPRYVYEKALAGSSYSPHLALRFVESTFSVDYTTKYNEVLKSKYSIEKASIRKADKDKIQKNNKSLDIEGFDNYKLHKAKTAQKLTNDALSDVFVLEPKKQLDIIEIGTYKIASSRIAHFKPDNIAKSLWKDTQDDYLGHDQPERNTRRTRVAKLSYLNAYLFDYLPHFFKENETAFEYPDTPEKFLGFIFVKTSKVAESVFKSKIGEKELIYPISLVDFITECADSKRQAGTVGNNLTRDTLATIERYFDYMINSFGYIDGLKIESNPLKVSAKRFGRRYNSSSKQKFELMYWVYFRVFIKEMSKHVLLNAVRQMIDVSHNSTLQPKLSELRKLETDISAFIKKTSSENTSSKIVNQRLDINSEILISENLSKLKLTSIDLSEVPNKNMRLESLGYNSQHIGYQYFFIVLVLAYAGQRSSNAAWLDVDSFDAHYKDDDSVDYDELVDVNIYTDKTKPTGFDSVVPKEIMEMLIFVKRFRNMNDTKEFREPIFYQANKETKKGRLRPLLQTTAKNTPYDYSLVPFLVMFEQALDESNIEYQSHVFNGPVGVMSKEFIYYRENDGVPSSRNYWVIDNQHKPFGSFQFTPIEKKSLVTPHSLRKQIDSVFNVLTSDRTLVGMITGQSENVVSYYTCNTPEEVAELKTLEPDVLKTIVSPKDVAITIENLIECESKEDFIKKYNPISTHVTNEIGGGVSDLDLNKELALNWTHICPFNNDCPNDVVREIGRMNCHKCPKAISLSNHKPAIAATIKKLLDEVKEINERMASPENINPADLEHFKIRHATLTETTSNWKVRHALIEKHGIIVGDKDELVNRMKYEKPGTFAHNLIMRLKEVDDCPALQSEMLKKIAGRITRNLYRQADLLPHILNSIEDKIDDNPVSFAIATMQMISDVNNIPIEDLVNKDISIDSIKLLEVLGE